MIILKYAFLFVSGLVLSLLIYPFFHESGHALALMLFNEEILNVELFPVPNVLCEITDITNGVSFFVIGFAGEVLPLVITFAIWYKGFWGWYFKISIRLICLLSFLVSLISMRFYKTIIAFQQDDIINIISNFPQYTFVCTVVLIFLSAITVFLIVNDLKQFNVKKIYLKF